MTAVRPFVFLGPSLPLADAQTILDAEYLPPVAMGDVYRLMARKPAVIAIVDGLFEQTPAVWHKEILFALHAGVRVLGASSMGALRAAELAAFGMEGVGDVFEAFRRGDLEDDDEVAVAHAPASDGWRCVSDAMVTIRAGLRAARDGGLIGARTHDRLVAGAKALFYPDRSWPRVLQMAAELGVPAADVAALRDFIRRVRPDVKRADAIRLLQMLADEQRDRPATAAASVAAAAAAAAPVAVAPSTPAAPRFDFEPTWFWEQMLLHESEVEGDAAPDDPAHAGIGAGADGRGEGVSVAALRRHVRLHAARARDVLGAALMLYLADEQAARRGVDLGAAAAAASTAQSQSQSHLSSQSSAANGEAAQLPPAERELLARSQAAVEALLASLAREVNRKVPMALAHLGRLSPTLAAVRRKQAVLRSLGLRAASPADAGVTLDELLDWHRQRFGPLAGSPDEHAAQAGFASAEEFLSELVLEYLLESDRSAPSSGA